MKSFWWRDKNNLGDMLGPVILEHYLGVSPEYVHRGVSGKVLSVGSILGCMAKNDIVWGSGWHRVHDIEVPDGVGILAVRGPLSRQALQTDRCPEVYGDPAILMPLVYPRERTNELGPRIVPHFVDKPLFKDDWADPTIDIQAPWMDVIDQITRCEHIYSSSLHGLIVAHAYGVPCTWMQWSNKIIGGEYKFQDYFMGIGIGQRQVGTQLPPIPDLPGRQQALLYALEPLVVRAFREKHGVAA